MRATLPTLTGSNVGQACGQTSNKARFGGRGGAEDQMSLSAIDARASLHVAQCPRSPIPTQILAPVSIARYIFSHQCHNSASKHHFPASILRRTSNYASKRRPRSGVHFFAPILIVAASYDAWSPAIGLLGGVRGFIFCPGVLPRGY